MKFLNDRSENNSLSSKLNDYIKGHLDFETLVADNDLVEGVEAALRSMVADFVDKSLEETADGAGVKIVDGENLNDRFTHEVTTEVTRKEFLDAEVNVDLVTKAELVDIIRNKWGNARGIEYAALALVTGFSFVDIALNDNKWTRTDGEEFTVTEFGANGKFEECTLVDYLRKHDQKGNPHFAILRKAGGHAEPILSN